MQSKSEHANTEENKFEGRQEMIMERKSEQIGTLERK